MWHIQMLKMNFLPLRLKAIRRIKYCDNRTVFLYQIHPHFQRPLYPEEETQAS